MRADSVDWEGTEQLKDSDYELQTVDYDLVDGVGEDDQDDYLIPGQDKPLTAADLRKVGKGLRLRRAAAPSIIIEVPADGARTVTYEARASR